MSKKIYVLDTNVLLSDFNALYAFKANDLVLPLKVLEEIDKHKKRQDGVGANARQVIRELDKLREKGSLVEGIKLGSRKGNLFVKSFGDHRLPTDMNMEDPDNQILATALRCMLDNSSTAVVLVSQDINVRVKADALGITAEDYTTNQIVDKAEEVYTGFVHHLVDDAMIDRFYSGERMSLEEKDIKLFPNQYLMLVSNANEKKTALARFKNYNHPLSKVKEYKDGVWDVRAKNKEQQFALDLLLDQDIKIVSLVGRAGCGKTLLALAAGLQQILDGNVYKKLIVSRPVQPMGRDIGFLPGPQPLDAKIATPNGWTEMGKINVGSEVIGGDGKPTKVLGVFPKGKKPVYKITTTDGSSTECCEDHLWLTQTAADKKRNKNVEVKTTKEIISTLKTSNGKVNHFLPRVKPVEYSSKELPIAPYTLGVLLGDGCIKDSVAVCNTDLELIKRVEEELVSLGCKLENNGKSIVYNIKANLYNNKPARQVLITRPSTGSSGLTDLYPSIGMALEALDINKSTLQSRCENASIVDGIKYEFIDNTSRWQNPVKNTLFVLGLENKKSYEKFIPELYKIASVQDRIALLQGLMDTDGSVKKSGEASFTTTSQQLAKDVQEVVRSLGGRAIVRERNRIGKKSYIDGREVISKRVSYEFTISLPNDINPFYISRKASRHSSKYIHGVGIESIELVGEKEVQCILVDNDNHLYVTDEFIVTHNTLEEKMMPWIAPIQDNLEFLMGDDKEHMKMLQEQGTIEIEALTFIRGRSISNAFIIIDEAQNLTMHELKTIITRVGEGTKIILTGDIDQIDSAFLDATNNGLTYAVEKFKPYELAGHISLQKGERSAVASLAASVL